LVTATQYVPKSKIGILICKNQLSKVHASPNSHLGRPVHPELKLPTQTVARKEKT